FDLPSTQTVMPAEGEVYFLNQSRWKLGRRALVAATDDLASTYTELLDREMLDKIWYRNDRDQIPGIRNAPEGITSNMNHWLAMRIAGHGAPHIMCEMDAEAATSTTVKLTLREENSPNFGKKPGIVNYKLLAVDKGRNHLVADFDLGTPSL